MKTPTSKPTRKNTYHRDGTVSYYDVFLCQWQRWPADSIDNDALSSMTQAEREQITKHAYR